MLILCLIPAIFAQSPSPAPSPHRRPMQCWTTLQQDLSLQTTLHGGGRERGGGGGKGGRGGREEGRGGGGGRGVEFGPKSVNVHVSNDRGSRHSIPAGVSRVSRVILTRIVNRNSLIPPYVYAYRDKRRSSDETN